MEKIMEGYTAEIFRQDDGKVLKLYKPGFQSIAEIEFNKMKVLGSGNFSVPAVYSFVEKEGRTGYIMDFIDGVPMSEELFNRDRQQVIKDFVSMQHSINSTDIVGELFESKTKALINGIDSCDCIEKKEKESIKEFLVQTNKENLCHNDFHFNNILHANDGYIIIDWNGAGSGNCVLDIAKTIILLGVLPAHIAYGSGSKNERTEITGQYVDECMRHYDELAMEHIISAVLARIIEMINYRVMDNTKLLKLFKKIYNERSLPIE